MRTIQINNVLVYFKSVAIVWNWKIKFEKKNNEILYIILHDTSRVEKKKITIILLNCGTLVSIGSIPIIEVDSSGHQLMTIILVWTVWSDLLN